MEKIIISLPGIEDPRSKLRGPRSSLPRARSACSGTALSLLIYINPEAPNGMIKYVAKSPFLTYFIR
jgi:hypothetical protein